MTITKDDVEMVEDQSLGMDNTCSKADFKSQAKTATENELRMSLSEAFRRYPKAIGWSMLLSTAVIMEGYDLLLVTSFFAFPPWTMKYGELQPDGSYQLSAQWQAGLYNGAAVGEMLGLFAAGYLAERIGYRKVMLIALSMITAFIFIPFFAPNVQTLLVGSILMGIPWGVFQTVPTTYAAEICPVALRAYLTTYVNLCWVMGQLLASGVLRAFLARQGEWAYRIPYALQWMWPVPIIVGILLAPESPWWLVRKGREAEAKKVIQRLTLHDADDIESADNTVAMMIHTNELEKEMSSGTSYLDCFKGTDLRRTEISCVTWAIQNLCGSAFMNNSTYFFIQAGLDQTNSFNFSMGQYAIGFIGTVSSWFLLSYFGRRRLYVVGLTILAILLYVIGFTGIAPDSNKGAKWASGSMLLVFALIYNMTVGPVCYSIVSEISSLRLRAKTIVLARNLYNVFSIVNGVITPYMLNPTAWNWKAKTGFFWAGSCTLCLLWCFFRLPESKGRTFAELDELFNQKINARKFATTHVDLFSDEPTVTEGPHPSHISSSKS
jgi:SP family general alpha glucoside:H+ symporter-like MFS transporter